MIVYLCTSVRTAFFLQYFKVTALAAKEESGLAIHF
jgi:hypothetical protein